ncbi:hypothetical protein Tco_1456665 [Tanacetum coccineum]
MSLSLTKRSKELKQEMTEEVHEMLNIFNSMEKKVETQSQKDNMFQNEIDQLLEASFTREIRDCVLISNSELENEILMLEKEKISSDSKDIQANLLKRIKILENDFKQSQTQTTRVQHQREVNELTENVNQKTYAYGDVRSQNQDLLMTISELKDKIKTIVKRKNVNIKFDKSETLEKLLCVTPFNTNSTIKAKKVSNSKVKANRSNPVTSHSTPQNEQSQKHSANVIARGMYRITKTETHTPVTKTNIFVSNSERVESSNSVKKPKSKDAKSKNRVLKNTNVKSPYTNARKVSSSVSVCFNKCETINSTVCQSNANVLKTKTVNAINDGSNIACVSYGKDVFMLSHEKCIACYALSLDSRVKRALLTSLVAAKSRNLRASSVVSKSRFNVAKTPTATNKVSSASSLSPNSSHSMTLSNYMKNKIATNRKWQKWFEHQQSFNWSPKSKITQSTPSVSKSSTSVRKKIKTPVTTQKWVAKQSTLPSTFVSCDAGDPARPLDY